MFYGGAVDLRLLRRSGSHADFCVPSRRNGSSVVVSLIGRGKSGSIKMECSVGGRIGSGVFSTTSGGLARVSGSFGPVLGAGNGMV